MIADGQVAKEVVEWLEGWIAETLTHSEDAEMKFSAFSGFQRGQRFWDGWPICPFV